MSKDVILRETGADHILKKTKGGKVHEPRIKGCYLHCIDSELVIFTSS